MTKAIPSHNPKLNLNPNPNLNLNLNLNPKPNPNLNLNSSPISLYLTVRRLSFYQALLLPTVYILTVTDYIPTTDL